MHSQLRLGTRSFRLCNNPRVSRSDPKNSRKSLAIFLIVSGLIGLLASFQLTLDKFRLLENPEAKLSCDLGLFISCQPNLNSPQGSVFGFPNPLIGIACFVAPIAIGVGILAGARFVRWFWLLFNVGITAALVLVIWFIGQSLFVLGTLCPWCLVTWLVVIPMFWTVTLFNLKTGHIPVAASVRRFSARAYGWIVTITLVSYLIVAVLIEIALDALRQLF